MPYASLVAIRVGVVGAGSWGTTIASMAALNTSTILWARSALTAEIINADHRNPAYLGKRALPTELIASHDLEEVVRDADVVVMAVPSQGFREVLRAAAAHVRPSVPIVSVAKGLEQGSLMRMSEVIASELPGHPAAVLTGPNLAQDIMDGQPAASVVARAGKKRNLIFGETRMRPRAKAAPNSSATKTNGVRAETEATKAPGSWAKSRERAVFHVPPMK